jgi:hypothetical protein
LSEYLLSYSDTLTFISCHIRSPSICHSCKWDGCVHGIHIDGNRKLYTYKKHSQQESAVIPITQQQQRVTVPSAAAKKYENGRDDIRVRLSDFLFLFLSQLTSLLPDR